MEYRQSGELIGQFKSDFFVPSYQNVWHVQHYFILSTSGQQQGAAVIPSLTLDASGQPLLGR